MSSLCGQIVISYGRSYIVEVYSQRYSCVTRAKKANYVCGDIVEITPQNNKQAVIEKHFPRKSLLYRQDAWRSKLIAANVSRLLIVTSASPTPSEEFLNRALVAAEAAKIIPIILVNKSDLTETADLLEKLAPYRKIGYQNIVLSALQNVDALHEVLQGETSLLLGQSGMGKSTLLNALLPNANARTGDISSALDSGRHTTTNAELYRLNENSELIDSPGLQEFGLQHLEQADLAYYFPEMRQFIGECRFHNCRHSNEPNCAIKIAANNGFIYKPRLAFLQRLTEELKNLPQH